MMTITLLLGCAKAEPPAEKATAAGAATSATVDLEVAGKLLAGGGLDDLPDNDLAPLPAQFPLELPRPENGAIEQTSAALDADPSVTEDWVYYVVPQGQLDAVVEEYKARLELLSVPVADEATDRTAEGLDRVTLTLDYYLPTRVVLVQTGAAVSVAVFALRADKLTAGG